MWLRAVSRIRDKLGDGPQARACDTSLITLKVAILPRLLHIRESKCNIIRQNNDDDGGDDDHC